MLMDEQSLELPIGANVCADGHAKTIFATREGARKAAVELKDRFPSVQVKIYGAAAKQAEVAR